MLDHLSIQCADPATSRAFHDAVLAPLGGHRILEFGPVTGCGTDFPCVWLGPLTDRRRLPPVAHRFTAPDRAAVVAFRDAAAAAGAEILHEFRVRPEPHEAYFGAFVRDPDGNNVEAVCHQPDGA